MRFNRPVLVQNLYGMYCFYFSIILIFLSVHSSMYTKSACVIIHGTWAENETWYRPCGDFFEAVKSCNNEIKIVDEVVSFSWSGKLGYPAQVQAAQSLVNFIELYDSVILIAHSHGATVGMIASQIIFKIDTSGNKKDKIAQFYSLGVPVQESIVIPNLHVIKKFYNLFSFGDFVQTINGICERTFSKQKQIANISVQYNNLHPSHTQLHHPALGIWLLKIEDFFAQSRIGNFDQFDFSKPACISFFSHNHPVYFAQEDQNLLLDLDKKIHDLAKAAFFRGRKNF